MLSKSSYSCIIAIDSSFKGAHYLPLEFDQTSALDCAVADENVAEKGRKSRGVD